MALSYCSISTPRHAHLLSLLLFFSSFQALYLTEGRPFLKLQELAKGGEEAAMAMAAAMIGSRPPRCEGRCLSCGQCEAIQVPAVPQYQKSTGDRHSSTALTSRVGDDSSVYKPLSWKCKCGRLILNP